MAKFAGMVTRDAIIEWHPKITHCLYNNYTKNIINVIGGNILIYAEIRYKAFGYGHVIISHESAECHGYHQWDELEFEDIEETEPYFKTGLEEFDFEWEFSLFDKEFDNYLDKLDDLGTFKIKELKNVSGDIDWELIDNEE